MHFIHRFSIFVLVLAAFSLNACGAGQDKGKTEAAGAAGSLSAEEQDKKALELFQQAYDILQNSDRKSAVPKLEALYTEVIDNYPKAVLSQECYWRLVLIYLNDYRPPALDKAEKLYGRFISLYPDSQFKGEIDEAVGMAYYRNGKWRQLMALYTPAVKQYIEKGKLSGPKEMFMYSEAKFNLGDLVEAEKGYKIVIALFPKTAEEKLSKQRIEQIKKKRTKNN